MRWIQQLRLAVAAAAVGIPMIGWSDDFPPLNAPNELQPATAAQTYSPTEARKVAPVHFEYPSEWRDRLADHYEDMKAAVPRQNLRARKPVRRKVGEIKGWFCYIRGHGPAIWVSD